MKPMNYDTVMKAVKVIAPDIDPSDYLEEGEIDVTDKQWSDVLYNFTDKEMKSICKECHAKYHHHFIASFVRIPIFTIIKPSYKEYIIEVDGKRFDSLQDLKMFLHGERNLLIYSIIHNIPNDTYMLRYFAVELDRKPFKMNWFYYMYNKLFVWKSRKRR